MLFYCGLDYNEFEGWKKDSSWNNDKINPTAAREDESKLPKRLFYSIAEQLIANAINRTCVVAYISAYISAYIPTWNSSTLKFLKDY